MTQPLVIIGIDPGTTESGVCIYDATANKIDRAITLSNEYAIELLRSAGRCVVAIEAIKSYGMPLGDTTIETCYWIGSMRQVASDGGAIVRLIPRKTICVEICGSPRAKDANIAQALRDLFGPKGTAKRPGPTYGISGHAWSALAVAVTARNAIIASAGIKSVA